LSLTIRKLTSEEVAKLFPKRGQMDLTDYVEALRSLKPGDAGEAPVSGLTSRALKRRLGQAAKQLGYTLRWAREQSATSLRFQVREARQQVVRTGKRGRPRKNP
jgi:hypothetical protein